MTKRIILVASLALLLVGGRAFAQGPASPWPPTCREAASPSGARTLICVPESWNGKLVAFAHGYLPATEPLQFADLTLRDGTQLPALVQQLGFAFATTTYRQNGLAVLEGTRDILDLVDAFERQHGAPSHTYVVGLSEGGLVATLAAEAEPGVFTAALAACAPIGNFRFQINYVGDFRVLFDVYFPGVIPGTAVEVPDVVRAQWDTVYVPTIEAAFAAHPARARELLKVARAPMDPDDATSVLRTALGLLWQNAFATQDLRARLHGNAFDNRLRWYTGSSNDLLLNLRAKRYDADVMALAAVQDYTPSGDLRIPLVALHTTSDELTPFAHQLIYEVSAQPLDRGRLVPVPVLRYGHCAVTRAELLTAFALMLGTNPVAWPATPVASIALPSSPAGHGDSGVEAPGDTWP